MTFSTNEVMASSDTLMHQAPATVEVYLRGAREHIDGVFGEGYAEKNPQLVAAFIQSCAKDLQTSMMKAGFQDLRDGLERVAAALEQRK